jgi:hypothetical protein
MKKHRYLFLLIGLLIISLSCFFVYNKAFGKISIGFFSSINQKPLIKPDYSDICLPPNIAPLNFFIKENGNYYYVKIYSKNGHPLEISGRSPKIIIPPKPWQQLLNENKNENLYFDIFVRNKNGWNKFLTIANKIAEEPIDDFLVYRKIPPYQSYWKEIEIDQRNLTSFDASPIIKNDSFGMGCVNCHTFLNNQPDKALYLIRSDRYGVPTLLINDGNNQKINTKFTYSCWHPSGKLITFSANTIILFFHSNKEEVRDVLDTDSMLAYYVIGSNKIKTVPDLSKKEFLETYPAWSPDGRYLYFCRAQKLWPLNPQIPPQQYEKVKYDLLRISYDITQDKWGTPQTVLSSKDTGLSITLPRISPDGRWLLFCMSDYGCFNAYNQTSDLYLMDLNDPNQSGPRRFTKLAANSTESESWHTWSSNSRWIVFSSKRDYGTFTKPYISFVDKDGISGKPFVLPQKDPLAYDSIMLTFNTPELVKGPVKFSNEDLAALIRSPNKISADMPITMATPKAKGGAPEPYRGRE